MDTSSRLTPEGDTSTGLTPDELETRLARIPPRGVMRRLLVATALAFAFDNADQAAMGIIAPAARSDLGVGLNEIALLVSVTYLGLFAGAVAGGYVSDRIGRLRLMRHSLVLASVGTLGHVFVSGMTDFVALRFVSAVGMGGLYVASLTYVAEVTATDRRGSRIALTYFFGQIGATLLVTSARFIIPLDPAAWRYVVAIGGLGLLVLAPMVRLPESPAWLLAKGRVADAAAAVAVLERSVRPGDGTPAPDSASAPVAAISTELDPLSRRRPAWTELFGRDLAPTTLLLVAVWVVYSSITLTYAGWLPTILELQGFSTESLLTISAVAFWGAPVGALLSLFIVDRVPRFRLWAIVVVLAALCGVTLSVAPAGVAIAVAAFTQYALFGLFAPVLNTLVADSFPTQVRASGTGVAFSAGRLTNVIAPFTLAVVLAALGHVVIGWYLMTAWLVIGVAGLLLRRRHAVQRASVAVDLT